MKPFTADRMAGTFSLRPLLDGLSPWAAPFLLALTFAVVMTVGFVGRGSKTDAAVIITLGYCVALLLLHRSFSHYFLPVIAMILVIPHPGCISEHCLAVKNLVDREEFNSWVRPADPVPGSNRDGPHGGPYMTENFNRHPSEGRSKHEHDRWRISNPPPHPQGAVRRAA